MNGTGWRTLDLKVATNVLTGQDLSAGAHYDGFTLKNRRFATADWINGEAGSLIQEARGHTRTLAVWAQDQVVIAPTVQLTLGARYEWWKAYGGRNFSASPALEVNQPVRTAQGLSPKASVRWQPAHKWTLTLSGGRALRFPTVSELYQAISTGATITVPNPNLNPEKALSAEFAVERGIADGSIRLSLFHERIKDALISQSGPLPGQTQLFSYVQNVDRVRTNGLELAIEKRNLLPRFDISGSFTLADPKIVSDPVFPAAEGKLIPQVPRRKATLVATWRPTDRLSLTAAGRYSSRLYGTIDNSDVVGHTYQGFEGYFVADVRALYHLTRQIDVAAGVENLTDKRYFLFHPFPGRTFTAELHWHL
jgi:iron complex outermembrane receptor protein